METTRLRIAPRMSRQRALWILLGAMVIVYALWNIDVLEPIAYPFRLFVTYVHEAGHSLMALLTNGRVLGFTVSSDGSGVATTAGGNRAFILMAGYLGATLFGAVLFFIVNTAHRSRTIAIIVGGLLVIFTLMYARPDHEGLPIALIVGLFSGLGLIAAGWKLGSDFNQFVLNVLAMMTGLNAVFDIVYLTRYNRVTEALCDRGTVLNDAAAFSCEVAPAIPPTVWAFLWAGLAVLMLAASVYYSILRPMLNSKPEAGRPSALPKKTDDEIDFSQFV